MKRGALSGGIFPVLLNLLLLIPQYAGAAEDPREEYRIALAGFTALGLPREHAYLAQALPRLMLHTLAGLDSRYISDKEKSAYIWRIEREARREAALKSAKAREDNSFDAIKSGSLESQLNDETTETEEEGLLPAEIQDYKRIELFNGPGEIPDLPVDPAQYCRENDLDMLISGRIESIGELVYFSLEAYTFAEARWDEFFFSASGFTTLEDALLQARGALREKVLGRPWSSLSIITRRDAWIYLDGELRGVGGLNNLILSPGGHRIRIEAEAAETLAESVFLQAGEEQRLEFSLTESPVPEVEIVSDPEGAEVYLSSLWAGTTPLLLPDTGRSGTLRLVLEGYRDVLVPAAELETGKNSFILERQLYDPDLRLKAKRDRLYTAVGLFTLSLPVTMFSYSLYRDYWNQAALYNDSGFSDRSFLYNGAFYGSLFGSSMLFVHMVRSLIDYRVAGAETF
ncbi:PEGA domain-containing protein [Marispirochaeta aestuarii]|uniref:PEGA domain-containing protein n=1 Tax=Marispirochaeta aestuarii TaxID=1963862 RepID=UPI0029C71F39|nr:PEGA domain-containing protein [Marispirochaeta aestuarii]